MLTFAVLATGQSMNPETADFVRGKCHVITVSDAYKLAPWADALVSNDAKWWRSNPDALEFAGRRFSYEPVRGVEPIKGRHNFRYGINSGLQAMRVAWEVFGATRILLCGFDMHGSHYFGPHTAVDPVTRRPLRNSDENRFAIHLRQFRHWDGCEVVNCTANSALTQFPIEDIREVLRS